MTLPTIRRLTALDAAQIHALAGLLRDCVAAGASVSFMHPLAVERAQAFWEDVAAGVRENAVVLLVAEDMNGVIVGTVQLVPAGPENQPHRADVAKMLVHPDARRRGVGAALMAAIEAQAGLLGKTLLVLDTVTGSDGERLYTRAGWQRCGVIPGYALWPAGGLCATTIFFKPLSA